jgi:tetratricopeptide (TPR) repeat protein
MKFFKATTAVAVDSKPISYVYLWNNEDFNRAEALTIEGKYDEALDVYNTLLQGDLSREDIITKSQLNIRIATLLDAMGEKSQAAAALNQIAIIWHECSLTHVVQIF